MVLNLTTDVLMVYNQRKKDEKIYYCSYFNQFPFRLLFFRRDKIIESDGGKN